MSEIGIAWKCKCGDTRKYCKNQCRKCYCDNRYQQQKDEQENPDVFISIKGACTKCNKFPIHNLTQRLCKKCYGVYSHGKSKKKRNQKQREYYARKHPGCKPRPENYVPMGNRRNRILHLAKLYGITEEQHEAIRTRQNGVCSICSKTEATRDLSVDHCHQTGKVRELLCHRCNRAIGMMYDSPELLFLASAYTLKWKTATNDIAPNLVPKFKPPLMKDSNFSDYSEFIPSPLQGDFLKLSEMIQTAYKLQEALKLTQFECSRLQDEYRNLIEREIPQAMETSGVEEFVATGGIRVKIQLDDFANIPSLSGIDKERDPDVRDRLLDRRNAALTLVAQKAPTLIKRSYEIDFDRDDAERALDLEAKLRQGGVPFIKGETVHPKTLAKWVKDCKLEGIHLSQEELETLGVFTKKVAKISK